MQQDTAQAQSRGRTAAETIETVVSAADLRKILASDLGGSPSEWIAVIETLTHLLADKAVLDTISLDLTDDARDAATLDGQMDKVHDSKAVLLSALMADDAAAGLLPGPYRLVDAGETGPGTAPQTQEHATEQFSTTRPRGRGAALSMSWDFGEQPDEALLLDGAAEQDAAPGLRPPRPPAGQTVGSLGAGTAKRPRIMLVDDDLEVLEMLGEVLAACGYNVEVFDNAAGALEHLHGEAPADLLITDLSMPGTNGLALIREAQHRQPGLPAILLTGYSGAELGLATGRLPGGLLVLLQKPVRTNVFTKQVAAVLTDAIPPAA